MRAFTMPAAHATNPRLRTNARDIFVRRLTWSLAMIGIGKSANRRSVVILITLL